MIINQLIYAHYNTTILVIASRGDQFIGWSSFFFDYILRNNDFGKKNSNLLFSGMILV